MAEFRRLKEEDIREVVDLGAQLHEEGSYRVLKFDKEKMAFFLRKCLTMPNSMFCAVASDEGKIIGMALAISCAPWFSKDLIVVDLTISVVKRARGSHVATVLINMLENWSKEQNAKYLTLGISTGINVVRTGKLYTHLGYTFLGGNYRKEF